MYLSVYKIQVECTTAFNSTNSYNIFSIKNRTKTNSADNHSSLNSVAQQSMEIFLSD